MGHINVVADLLSRWSITDHNVKKLHAYVENALWLQLGPEYLALDYNI